jgi:hypothetical protein
MNLICAITPGKFSSAVFSWLPYFQAVHKFEIECIGFQISRLSVVALAADNLSVRANEGEMEAHQPHIDRRQPTIVLHLPPTLAPADRHPMERIIRMMCVLILPLEIARSPSSEW